MGDFFSFESDTKNTVKNVLHGSPHDSNVNVIVAEYLEESQLSFLIQFFKICGAEPLIVYPFSRVVTDRDFRKGIEKFFVDNVIENLKDFLNPHNSVVTVGRGLYAATRDVDLQVEAFYYNDELQPPYFYCPFLKNFVYPIDAMQKIIKTEYKGSFVQLYDRYVTEFAKEQVGRAILNHQASVKEIEPVNITEVKDANAWLKERALLTGEDYRYVSFDIETGGFNRLTDEIGCLSVTFDGKTAYFLKWKGVDPDLLWQFLKTRYLIGANVKFDILFLMFHGVKEIKASWDTMIVGHFINEMMSASLKAHAWVFTDYGGYDIELEKYKRKYPGCRYIDIPTPILKKYAGMDAICTWLIWKKQREILENHPDLLAYYERYAIGMLDVFKEMEFRGFPIDWDMVNEQSTFLKQKIAEAEKTVFDAFGIIKTRENANLLTSKKQLGLFLEDRGWECISRVKTRIGGYFNVSKNQLNEWKKKGHKEAELILEYNKWTAVYNTFIGAEDSEESEDEEALFDGMDYSNSDNSTGLWQYRQIDDKIHNVYRTMMTHSHRHSSTEPNTQNLSKRNWETAQLVRKCYTAPLEIETEKENAHFLKVYDAEHGLRLFKPDDTFSVNWQTTKYNFDEADTIPGIVAQYYENIPKGKFRIFEADASGLQARIAASMSGDPKLCELFLNNGDFHSTNAYNMMARYQKFEELQCLFAEGGVVFMEWEPLKIIRDGKELEHAIAKDLREGDTVEPHGVLKKINRSARSLKDYNEFNKNCKHGKLKELRQIAKMCFAKGTKIKMTGERVYIAQLKQGDLLLLDTETGASIYQWHELSPKLFRNTDTWEEAVQQAEELKRKFGYSIYEIFAHENGFNAYTLENRYVNIEDLLPKDTPKFYNVGIPYIGKRFAFDPDGDVQGISGVIQVQPKEKIEFELENGETLTVTPDHEMPVMRDGNRIIVPAEQVLETDEFIEV